jgi:hypothetical protein
MTSLSDLTKHMANFLLASQRLTQSDQGETPYRYFKLFLETVVGFPSIGLSLTTYYAQHPAIANQSVDTLLRRCAWHQQAGQPTQPPQKKAPGATRPTQCSPRWSPHDLTLLAATTAPTATALPDYSL